MKRSLLGQLMSSAMNRCTAAPCAHISSPPLPPPPSPLSSVACPAGCAYCRAYAPAVCLGCADGMGLVNGACTACTVEGCARCDGNAAKVRPTIEQPDSCGHGQQCWAAQLQFKAIQKLQRLPQALRSRAAPRELTNIVPQAWPKLPSPWT